MLLPQTSCQALAEERWFRHPDRSVRRGSLRVCFGEDEQRGVALTRAGRDLYGRMVGDVDAQLASAPEGTTPVVQQDSSLDAAARSLGLQAMVPD